MCWLSCKKCKLHESSHCTLDHLRYITLYKRLNKDRTRVGRSRVRERGTSGHAAAH